MVDSILQGNVEEVDIAHKDRLCRFAFDLLEWICKRGATNVVVEEQSYVPLTKNSPKISLPSYTSLLANFTDQGDTRNENPKYLKVQMISRKVRNKTTPEQSKTLRFCMKTYRQTYHEALRLVKDKKAKINMVLKKLVVSRRDSDQGTKWETMKT